MNDDLGRKGEKGRQTVSEVEFWIGWLLGFEFGETLYHGMCVT